MEFHLSRAFRAYTLVPKHPQIMDVKAIGLSLVANNCKVTKVLLGAAGNGQLVFQKPPKLSDGNGGRDD